MNKLKEIINNLSIQELKLLQKDLVDGNMERLISNKIKNITKERGRKICPVCNAEINEKKDIVLMFGPENFRKKAVFCAYDCLEYFLSKLKVQNQVFEDN